MRLESCPSSDGIDPLRLLPARFSVEKVEVDMFPSSVGIGPVRPPELGRVGSPRGLVLSSLSVASADRFSSSDGSVPFSG